jgi:peroxin-14
LAEGWYDPATLEKARSAAASAPGPVKGEEQHPAIVPTAGDDEEEGPNDDDDDDDEYGPMPQYELSSRGGGRAPGPAIPTMQDLELRKGTFSQNSPGFRVN